MSDLLIKNACVITCDKDAVITDGYIRIEGNKIVAVGKMVDLIPPSTNDERRLPASASVAGATNDVIDAGGRIVMPGLVNAHTHLYSQLARGISVPRMRTFGEVLEGLWWKLDNVLDKDCVYVSGVLGLIEAIKAGVTTMIDHHASYGFVKGSLNTLAKAFTETGMRGVLCYEVSDRNGEKQCNEAIEENVGFLGSLRSAGGGEAISPSPSPSPQGGEGNLMGMFGLHASFTVSSATIKRVHKANEKFSAPYHIHVAEGPEDVADAKSRYKSSVIQRLYDEGVLCKNTIAAHCIHINDEDIQLLKKSGAFVVHNPVSNMNNAVGRAPYLRLMAAGIPVGIGTDGMSSGIMADVKAASVVHKGTVPVQKGDCPLMAGDPQAGWDEVRRSVLEVNPLITSRLFGAELGVIKPGALADVIIVDSVPFTPITSENYWGHILFGVANSRIHTTIVNGQVLMKEFEIKGIDEVSVVKEARTLSEELWKRFHQKQ